MKMKKILAAVLSLLMLLALFPTVALAADGEGSGNTESNDGVVLSKTAALQDDGTYTINLEAYATGTVTAGTAVPTDVVLLLDVSGSMEEPFSFVAQAKKSYSYDDVYGKTYYYYYNGAYYEVTPNSSGWWFDQYYSLTFDVNGTTYYLQSNGSASTDSHTVSRSNTTIFTGVLYTAGESRMDALKSAVNSFIDATAEKNVGIEDVDQQHRLSIVKFAGKKSDKIGDDTYKDTYVYNYTQIVTELAPVTSSNSQNLKNTVTDFTAAGATSIDYGLERAEVALQKSTDGRAKVIIVFTDGEPTHGSSFQNSVASDAVNKAKGLKDAGVTIYTISVLSGSDPSDTTSNMNKYMHGMSSNYPQATASYTNSTFNVTFGDGSPADGYYKYAGSSEELSSIFENISDSVGSTTVTLGSESVMKDIISDEFTLPEGYNADGSDIVVKTADYLGNGVFDTPVAFADADVNVVGKSINVSGFDYKANYVVDGSADGAVQTSGKKLIVTITGVEATEAAATGKEVYTNDPLSGIYSDGTAVEPVKIFTRPITAIGNKTYVLDYAKPAELTDLGQSVTHLDKDGMQKFTTSDLTGFTKTYGTVSYNDGALTYTPKTTNWDGYDSFFAFGKTAEDANSWSKVSVLPANNVYYEDDFITNAETGVVGIVYDGVWTVDSTASGNTETANGSVQGWVDSLADDTQYSDGSAHKSDLTNGGNATATFTFTGTGVDIYSRTNAETGTIIASLRGNDDSGAKVSKAFIIDNKAASGDYYQIPTATFTGLPHGTYTVTITVTTAAASEGRYTYYLDGIRIYNPIQDLESESTVQDAYKNELSATFTEVRTLLNSQDSTAYIDEGLTEEGKPDGQWFVGDYSASDTGKLAPEHEVYLNSGEAVAINVTGASNYYIGLKAPLGGTAAAEITAGGTTKSPITVSSASDLYYSISPDGNGIIVIKNTGESLLSITKLRTTITPDSGASGVSFLSLDDDTALTTYAAFSSYSLVAYNAAPATEEELEEQEKPEVTEPEEPAEPETPEEEGPGEVVIENPTEPEKPADEVRDEFINWLTSLFNSMRKIIGRH